METLIRKRGISRSALTRGQTYYNQLDMADIDQIMLESRIKKLDECAEQFSTTHSEIISACDPADIDVHEEVYNEFEEKHLTLRTKLVKLRVNAGGSSSPHSSTRQLSADIKLPKLDLPVFYGETSEWLSFRDLFCASVHNNSKLCDSQKLQYLRSSVKGEAAQLIQSFKITNDNYKPAWSALEDRYNNEREIIKVQFDRLFSQPVIQQQSADALRKLIDTTNECVQEVNTFLKKEDWMDQIIIHVISRKLDPQTRLKWEEELTCSTSLPSYKEFKTFMDTYAQVLLNARGPIYKSKFSTNAKGTKPQQWNGTKKSAVVHHGAFGEEECIAVGANHSSAHVVKCALCGGQHYLGKCHDFISKSYEDKKEFVFKNNLCFKCLNRGHRREKCNYTVCKILDRNRKECGGQHHRQMHPPPAPPQKDNSQQIENGISSVTSCFAKNKKNMQQVILPTALIQVRDKYNNLHKCRALLDNGSEASFISQDLASKLQLSREKTSVPITGLAVTSAGTAEYTTQVCFTSHFDQNKEFKIEALIMKKITGTLPSLQFNPTSLNKNLLLADPNYFEPGKIDILLGADNYGDLLRDGLIQSPGEPTAQNSALGWLLSGSVSQKVQNHAIITHHVQCELNENLQRFWELEELPKQKFFTQEEKDCERHFVNNHTINEEGRYVVRLPFHTPVLELGESRNMAVKRLKSVEKRNSSQPEMQRQHEETLQEYLDLDHMEEIPEEQVTTVKNVYYMPHHAVLKPSSTTTSFRVVFDASALSTNGNSLNKALMCGPKIQDDLTVHLTRFRTHPIAITADITKMYRQFLVHPEDRDYQRIVWRKSSEDPIKDYRMKTITFGTKSAPYQAVRCLQQLAEDQQMHYPEAAAVLRRDMYVDDLMTGASDVNQALKLQMQLIELTSKGKLAFNKWFSNCPEIIKALPPEMRPKSQCLRIDVDETVKTLGLEWHPVPDYFSFTVNINTDQKYTKRNILSQIAKVFDPLGWLAPVTIRAKIFMQSLWEQKLDWDDDILEEFLDEWNCYQTELPLLQQLKISRCIIPTMINLPFTHELHVFCDASDKAYAAVVYLKTIPQNGPATVKMITSKTKVAPLKKVTLPRLELLGAVLATHLLNNVQESLSLEIMETHAWTDSTIVQAWLSSPPQKWTTFVANRVAEVQGILPSDFWHHVRSEDNPADCASRGILPTELLVHPLWWKGPDWLSQDKEYEKSPWLPNHEEAKIEERRTVKTHIVRSDSTTVFIKRFSSLTSLRRVTAYVLRYFSKLKNRVNGDVKESLTISTDAVHSPLSTQELNTALTHLIKLTQRTEFEEEISCILNKKPLPNKTKILSLAPFLDSNGALRVGGRLVNAELPFDKKFPMLLPTNHHLTNLIIKHYHVSHLHAGPQLLLSVLQKRFWILRGRDVIRHFIMKCVTCHRQKAETMLQMMGNLPSTRVNPSRPFLNCGLDYAGPVSLRVMKGRGQKTFKGYVAVFVCFVTHAIHLEIVSDLSTQMFIAALKRFTGRRGKPNTIYSDCGSNFIGANRIMTDDLKKLQSIVKHDQVERYLTNEGISWQFNPPAAPHQGGLWEAAVKSMKFHFKRIVKDETLDYEQMATLLCQIEACLNSRPLTALSADPDDLSALTPGHFLIGSELTSIPEADYTATAQNRLTRWENIQRMYQEFWKRWSFEHLTRLQQRQKWMTPRENLKINDLVLVKEDNLPPTKWKLGRVLQLFPGRDNLVRVALVKTQTGEIKRPIVKLSLLPLDQEI